MAPSPQESMVEEQPQTIPRGLTGEECVVSGMSGLFPKSDSVLEFKENLYNGVSKSVFILCSELISLDEEEIGGYSTDRIFLTFNMTIYFSSKWNYDGHSFH